MSSFLSSRGLLLAAALGICLSGCSMLPGANSASGFTSRDSVDTPPNPNKVPALRPIPDRPGFYFAPGEESLGRIDGRNFTSGTVLRSPYSQKFFRIP